MSHATKIIFLVSSALEFLTFTNKSENGNKLQKDVFFKLCDTNLLTLLKADALMFHHMYADLVFLAKARELQKSAHDMKQHYLELKLFLEEVEECPAIVLNRYHPVFPSEPRLYNDSKFNHREHKHNCTASECIQKYLFQSLPEDKTILFSMITKGALSMRDKLCSYASYFLPNVIYWEPDLETTTVLQALEPSNDLCESILGLNDYLGTAVPNMLQFTKSNMIEMKKNHKMKWFHEIPEERQKAIIDLAVKNCTAVRTGIRQQQQKLCIKRQENMIAQKRKVELLRKKEAATKEKLHKLHLVTSVEEFESNLIAIKEEGLTVKKEEFKTVKFLKEQVDIRK